MMTDQIIVFFYGLFMDESLLASKGVHPKSGVLQAHVRQLN